MENFVIGEPVPKYQTLSKLKSHVDVSVFLENSSLVKSKFRLEGIDQQNICSFEFQDTARQTSVAKTIELWLLPNENITIPVRIIPPTSAWVDLKKTVYHFTLTSTMLTGKHPTRSVLGSLAVKPLIGPDTLLLTITCLVAAIFLTTQFITTDLFIDTDINRSSQLTESKLLQWVTPTPRSLDRLEIHPPENEEKNINTLAMTDEEVFQEIALQYGLNWHLLAEVAYQESRMNPLAIGKDNELGLMQILPSTWNEWSPKVGVSDPFDRYSNASVGAAYLVYVRDYARRKGYYNEYWMLVGYNWGPNNLGQFFDQTKTKIPNKPHQYATDILEAVATGKARWQTDTLLTAE